MADSAIPQAPASAQIPGWTVWQSPATRQWHARKHGSLPVILLHDNSVEGLREQIGVR
jgi:hypothetical protein